MNPPTMKSDPCQLRGVFAARFIHWIRDTYGEALYDRVLARLDGADRAYFRRMILSLGWYPLPTWNRFLDASRAEVRLATGEDEVTFDRRLMREAGGVVMQTLYRFVIAWVNPSAAISRVPAAIAKMLDQGSAETLENREGHALVRFRGPEELYPFVGRYAEVGLEVILGLSGAKDVRCQRARDEVGPVGFVQDIRCAYRAG
jgi:hypothetical protein